MPDITSPMIGYAILKGAVIASIMAVIGADFFQSIIVALISGSLGLIGMIGAAYISAKEARKNRAVMHDIKRKIGAAQREDDSEQA